MRFVELLFLSAAISSAAVKMSLHEPVLLGFDSDFELQTTEQLIKYTFEDFVAQFQRQYKPDSEEWKMREALFKENKKKVVDHRLFKTDATWTTVVNKFADWTPEEKQKILGYKGEKAALMRAFRKGNPAEMPMDGTKPIAHDLDLAKEAPASFLWHDHLHHTGRHIRDQGSCGSCWAVSTAAVMEAHVEKHINTQPQLAQNFTNFLSMAVSSQQIVSCTANPNNCGGSGGCDGATSELALEMIQKRGIAFGKDYMYSSGSGNSGICNDAKVASARIHIRSFVKLPENKHKPLLAMFYQAGPGVVSVAAGNFFVYGGGILDCGNDYVVNHAVMGVGYGADSEGRKYWMIKNSWGKGWGENGFARFVRYDDEESKCGWDTKAKEGTACDGGPDKVYVCGSCGILYDTAYPVGLSIA